MRFRCAGRPDSSLKGREKVVAKNGPFSLVFRHIMALMLPQRSVREGFLLLIAILFPPLFEMKLALSGEEESQGTFQRENILLFLCVLTIPRAPRVFSTNVGQFKRPIVDT